MKGYFGCGGQQEITQRYLNVQHEVYGEMGDDFTPGNCYICNKELGIGDYVDGFYPYHQEYNACKEHKDEWRKK